MAGEKITFAAVGDIGFNGATGESMKKLGADWPFENVRELLGKTDLLFGNMESVTPPSDYPKEEIDPRGLLSGLPGDECAAALKRAGFDFMNLAANHVLDAGVKGMFHTRDTIEAAGIATGGIGETQNEARKLKTLERGGISIGFLCYCEDNNYSLSATGPCHAYFTEQAVLEDIEKHRDEVDVLVISIHADIEFSPTPSPRRREISRRLAEAGAGIILEHHPHVPQGLEMHSGCLIAYSLGNFVFDAHTSNYMKDNGPHTADSYILTAEVTKNGVESWRRLPVVIGVPPEQRPSPAADDDKKRLEEYFRNLDEQLRDDAKVLENWRKTVRWFLSGNINALAHAENPVDFFLYYIFPRMLFVAEDRAVMDEAYRMTLEFWEEFRRADNSLHRPAYRLRK